MFHVLSDIAFEIFDEENILLDHEPIDPVVMIKICSLHHFFLAFRLNRLIILFSLRWRLTTRNFLFLLSFQLCESLKKVLRIYSFAD